jgi:hypothetical protein
MKKHMKPKFLKSKHKQAEGSTPRGAMPADKKSGKFGARMAKVREKRLEGKEM